MSLEALPDHVLLHVLARLQPCEAVAVSQTCSRLQRLALQSPVNLSSLLPGCQGVPLSDVVAAAGQRMHVVTGGTWRDALLLSAWQRQQISASPHGSQRPTSVRPGAPSPNTAASSSRGPLLQQVLSVPDAAAAAIAGDVPLSGGSSSYEAAAMVSNAAPSASNTGRRPLTEFGLYWQPDAQQLAQAGCLVMDGSAAVLLQNQPVATAGTRTAQGQTTAAVAGTAAPSQTHTPEAETGGVSADAPSMTGDQASSAFAPIPGHPMHSQLSLLQGHLPPAQDSADVPLHKQLLFPPGHPMAGSSSSSNGGDNPSHPLQHTWQPYGQYGNLAGLRPLLQFLQAWWHQSSTAAASTTPNSGAGDGPADQAAASSSSGSKDTAAGKYTGPRQASLLPSQPPPGSIPGLISPWPPVLSPGGTYLGLGQPGCDATSGTRSCPRLLRDSLLYNEPALLLPAGPTGLHEVPSLSGRFYSIPGPWQAELRHLDVSGQSALSEADLGVSFNSCSNLISLSIADTAAGATTFGMWPYRQQANETPAAAVEAAAAGREASTSRPGGGCVPTQSAQARLAAMQIAALATTAERASSSSSTAGSDANNSSSNGQQAPDATPSIPRAVCSSTLGCPLRVLDVSGCPALQVAAASGGAVFRSFQASLVMMTSLEVLMACRLNADAVFHCTCDSAEFAVPRALKAAPSTAHPSLAPLLLEHTRCRICRVLAGLHELDVSGSIALSAHTVAWLLSRCSSLRRLGVAGCKTVPEHDGAQCLEAGLLSMANLQHEQRTHQDVQQQGQGHPELPESSSTGSTTSSSSWRPPVCTVGSGLQRLCVGWGWSAAAISCVLRGSPFLISFTAGVGACVTDDVLLQLASSCPHLQSLCLTMCTVSSTGVAAVLQGCQHLTTLQLQQCVGPFSGAEMLPTQQPQQQQRRRWQLSTLQLSGPQTACSNDQLLQLLGLPFHPPEAPARSVNTATSSRSGALGRASSGGAGSSGGTNVGGEALEGGGAASVCPAPGVSTATSSTPASLRPDMAAQRARANTATSSSPGALGRASAGGAGSSGGTGVGGEALEGRGPASLRPAPGVSTATSSSSAPSLCPDITGRCRPTPRATAYLTALCLVRVHGLTDALLLELSAAGCRLQHLRLDHCYITCSAADKMLVGPLAATSSSGCGLRQSRDSSEQVVSFTSRALLALVAGSCALSLRSLTLRHAVALPPEFVAGLVQRAPLLQRLVLDACDLPGGFDLEPDLHAALLVIHVARCQSADGHNSSMGSHAGHSQDTTAAAAAGSSAMPGRLVDRDLVVHMLALRRTLHLPAG